MLRDMGNHQIYGVEQVSGSSVGWPIWNYDINVYCRNDGNGCGLNGNRCRPFSSSHLAFRCPSDCKSVQLLEPHVVGNQSLVYQGLVVGGPDPTDADSMPVYRGDSFICQAAIHAGVIANGVGGCGVATLTGTHHNFQPSSANGIQSVGFPSSFPRTFTFQTISPSQAQCPTDSRWPLFAVTAIFLVLLWLFTTSPATLFFSTFFILGLHVGLVSDPPNTSSFHELLSVLASRLLPASFIAWILYRYCAHPTLHNLRAQIEKPIFYLCLCFIGALNNYTFAPLIPIQRLTPHDIKSQPGAPIALTIILLAILTIVTTQIHYLRISGQMPKYLTLYTAFLLGLLILLVLPGMRLRIHHYILALLFMPGTAMQTRPALAYQGLLLGLFINGVMRWGFASIIQTPSALGEAGGGQGGSWWGAHAPNVSALVGDGARNISFHWGPLPTETGVDGVSILINDVERWRGYVDADLYGESEGVTLARTSHYLRTLGEGRNLLIAGQAEDGAEEDIADPDPDPGRAETAFYRFAWMNGNEAGRYGGVGVWDEKGSWIPPSRP
jgi:LCCL domain